MNVSNRVGGKPDTLRRLEKLQDGLESKYPDNKLRNLIFMLNSILIFKSFQNLYTDGIFPSPEHWWFALSKRHKMPHGRSSMRTILNGQTLWISRYPWLVQLSQIGHNTLHLLMMQRMPNHNTTTTRSRCKHAPCFGAAHVPSW